MAFVQLSTGINDLNVARYDDFAGQAQVSIRLTNTTASLCMTLAEAEGLRDKLSAILRPADEAAAKEVVVA